MKSEVKKKLPPRPLTKDQKQAIGILSIGTFLEYFDLMLYVHMAVLLNDLFFSKRDEFSAQLLSAFSFCITFICRPIGAYFIGKLGDIIGRKSTVIITSVAMAVTCGIMTFLPTYDEVGIIASVAVTCCRIVQGLSSMGERMGAEVYLTESIEAPQVYPAVASISGIFTGLGVNFALIVANISLSEHFNWRYAFGFGTIVALLGFVARRALRETSEFADAKRYFNNISNNSRTDTNSKKIFDETLFKEPINKKLVISYFLIQLAQPTWFYFSYIYCSNILKDKFKYSIADIMQHNLILAFIEFLSTIFFVYLVSKVSPLKILRARFYISCPFILLFPFVLDNISSVYHLFFIQVLISTIAATEFPAGPVFYKHFPIFKRFTTTCLSYAISRALMYVISSIGLTYVIQYFDNYGLLFLFIPIVCGYAYGLRNFLHLKLY